MGKEEIMVLINFTSKIKAIKNNFTAKLDFQMQKTFVINRKIDNCFLKIYDTIIAIFRY